MHALCVSKDVTLQIIISSSKLMRKTVQWLEHNKNFGNSGMFLKESLSMAQVVSILGNETTGQDRVRNSQIEKKTTLWQFCWVNKIQKNIIFKIVDQKIGPANKFINFICIFQFVQFECGPKKIRIPKFPFWNDSRWWDSQGWRLFIVDSTLVQIDRLVRNTNENWSSIHINYKFIGSEIKCCRARSHSHAIENDCIKLGTFHSFIIIWCFVHKTSSPSCQTWFNISWYSYNELMATMTTTIINGRRASQPSECHSIYKIKLSKWDVKIREWNMAQNVRRIKSSTQNHKQT